MVVKMKQFLILGSVVAFVVFVSYKSLEFGNTKAERMRFLIALDLTKQAREKIESSFRYEGKAPSSLGAIGIASLLEKPSSIRDDEHPGTVKVMLSVDGDQLTVKFDSDQGALSNKKIVFQAIEKEARLRCVETSVPLTYRVASKECDGAVKLNE
jgi:hypothetical protein